MTPLIAITIDGADVGAPIMDRQMSLRITDEAGIEADRLSLTLDDRDTLVAEPPHGATLRVSLGMAGEAPVPLTPMGVWTVDDTTIAGGARGRTMRVDASAADMAGAIRSPRTRAWEAVTLGDIVRTIAGEAGLAPVVAPDLADVPIAYAAQTQESDLHFLTRLGRRHSAVVKPAGGRLVMARRGAGQAGDGTTIPPVALTPGDATDWQRRNPDRGKYASAEASWTELATGQMQTVIVGEGTPRRQLRHVYAGEAEARRAATAALEDAARGAESLEIELATFWPQLFAGARITFADRPEMAGPWSIVSARHVLDGDLTTSIRAERPPQPETDR